MDVQPLALVTGAAHRLGKAFVLALARKGYAILLHYRTAEMQAAKTATEIRTLDVPVFLSQSDLTNPKHISAMFELVDRIPHPLKVRVNAVAPGLVLQSDLVSAEEWQRLIERLPLKRAASVEEIASALDFLLSNAYITGQTLVIDGGYSLLG